MIKEAIEKIIDLKQPTFKEIEGVVYSNHPMYEIEKPTDSPIPCIDFNTLTGFVDYINEKVDPVFKLKKALKKLTGH